MTGQYDKIEYDKCQRQQYETKPYKVWKLGMPGDKSFDKSCHNEYGDSADNNLKSATGTTAKGHNA